MEQNKTGKYLKYAIGEIVLVVIGILIALSINNWNQKQQEVKQIRNIYARIIKDFTRTATEIEESLPSLEFATTIMNDIIKGNVVRDSLLMNTNKYYYSIRGYADIKINETGIRLLESKIELNYELNTALTEALTLLYSEQLYEYRIDEKQIEEDFLRLREYKIEKGQIVAYELNNNKTKFVNMVFEDDTYKNYLFAYYKSHRSYTSRLLKFKTEGQLLIDVIKKEYSLE